MQPKQQPTNQNPTQMQSIQPSSDYTHLTTNIEIKLFRRQRAKSHYTIIDLEKIAALAG